MAYDFKAWLEMVNHATVIGGVAWAVIQWPKARSRERQRSYEQLNDQFLKFLELQLSAPALGTSAGERNLIWNKLEPSERAQQRTLFDFLASILERAYYFLNPARSKWEREQWSDWEHWLRRFAHNPNFVAFWQHLDDTGDEASYGEAFVALVKQAIADAKQQEA